MRTLLIAGTAVALLGADAASAGDRVVQRGPGMSHGSWGGARPNPRPMPQMNRPSPMPQIGHPRPMPQIGHARGARWGSKVNGRWWGGANAPGGWSAYRRPVRGWALPVYWITPTLLRLRLVGLRPGAAAIWL